MIAPMPLKRPSMLPKKAKSRRRDPIGTREAILEAAREILAHDGKEGLRVSKVANRAKVNRGTAYQHFQSREQLVEATAESVSEKMYEAVYGSLRIVNQGADSDTVRGVTEHLADFAMENPELSRAWLFELLSSQRPASDRFWREFESSFEQLAKTEYARSHIDTEVVSVLMLGGIFLWPIWARAHARNAQERQQMTQRLAREVLRLSMYGTLIPERFPVLEKLFGMKRKTRQRTPALT
jgi:AcrR family transcriptional regulator